MSLQNLVHHIEGSGIDGLHKWKYFFWLWRDEGTGIEPMASQYKEVIVVHLYE